MDVGVRQLKANLSEYLDRAERGELIRVTDRGQPKAILGPLPGRGRRQKGIDEGWITPAARRGLAGVHRHKSRARVLDVITDDRDDA